MSNSTLFLGTAMVFMLASCDMMTMPWNQDYTCTCFNESGMALEYEINDMPYRDAERMCNNLEQNVNATWSCSLR